MKGCELAIPKSVAGFRIKHRTPNRSGDVTEAKDPVPLKYALVALCIAATTVSVIVLLAAFTVGADMVGFFR